MRAAPRTNMAGDKGSIKLVGTGGATRGDHGAIRLPPGMTKAWADPLAVDAVIACAKDAYRNGFRADARRLLEPYFAELSCVAESDLGPDLSARLTAIDAMRRNLMDNVDFFGHPPGLGASAHGRNELRDLPPSEKDGDRYAFALMS